jgi:predicted alpha/beta superfamily hydrolase
LTRDGRIGVAAFAVIVTLGLGGIANAQPAAPPLATVWYSEEFVIHSKFVGRDFLIQVGRPDKPPSGKIPALYLLDGSTTFPEIANWEGQYAARGMTAPAYVVGIAYPARDRAVWRELRDREFRHTPRRSPPPGYAEVANAEGGKFQDFLLKELRPVIEARYPVDPAHSILAGHSAGGLFVTHVLLNAPGAFDTYVIGSPAIVTETALLDQAAAFHAPSPLRVFIGVGSKEEDEGPPAAPKGVTVAKLLAARLGAPGSGVTVSYFEVPDEGHIGMMATFYSRALRFALPPAPPKP